MQRKKSGRLFNLGLILFSGVCVLIISGFAIYNYNVSAEGFYRGTTINGINVGGMNVAEATNVVQTEFNNSLANLSINLTYKDKEWTFKGKDFEIVDDFTPFVQQAFNDVSSNNFLERRLKIKKLKSNGGKINLNYTLVLGGFDEKINVVCNEIYQELIEPTVVFKPDEKNMFEFVEGQSEIAVNTEALKDLINSELQESKNISVQIPVTEKKPEKLANELKDATSLRAKFTTSYKSSTSSRKSNVLTALKCFNGMVVMPEEEISFNATTGARTKENGYKPANIILNGMYVEGSGGGVCQASTTLYNALLLGGIQIVEVNKHSMPASYVPLGLDAMVSDGASDLRFVNNTNSPIYIKTGGDDSNVYVNIYGIAHENGEYYKTKSEFVKTLPHPGDRIVVDEKGEHASKVTFKGEYLRLKYPKEGYEAKAYLQRFSASGELIEEVLIRHEFYLPQEGIIIEGTEDVYEGITLPKNDVKFIPPQSGSVANKNNINSIIYGEHGEKYNP